MRDRPDDFLDPFSSVLSLLRVEGTLSARMAFGGRWCFEFPRLNHLKFGIVTRGGFWLVAGDERHRFEAGDCYLLTLMTPYLACSDPDLPLNGPEDSYTVSGERFAVARYGEPETVIITSRFTFDPHGARLLLEGLPPVIHIRANPAVASALQMVQDLLVEEMHARRPGSALMANHLAQIVFIQAMRAYMADRPERPMGWLGALGDPQLGAALRLIHAEDAKAWTLEELAGAAGMSRSSFAARFKERVGQAPIAYMARWRMHVAARALAGDRSVAAVAHELGYASESAFSAAFKRVMGVPPGRYRAGIC